MCPKLENCVFCGSGELQFHMDEECDGCHYLVCPGCNASIDLASSADPENSSETLEELRAKIAEWYNERVPKERLIKFHDWNLMVQLTYERPYDIQQQDGCRGRGSLEFVVPAPYAEDFEATDFDGEDFEMGVSFDTWLQREATSKDNLSQRWMDRMFWERTFYPHHEIVAQDLYKKGLLTAGKYVILIDW